MARPLRHTVLSTRALLLLLLIIGALAWSRRHPRTRVEPSTASTVEPDTPKPQRPGTQPRAYRVRIVAVGDLHGDLQHTMRVLQMARLVDGYGKWIASPNTVLVQTGDIVDRGRDTIALYRLFQELAVKGTVVNLLGNHEMMNALGDWRYVTPEDIATFGGERQRRLAMSAEGWLGKTWSTWPTTARIPYLQDLRKSRTRPPAAHRAALLELARSSPNWTDVSASFVHGGIHPEWAAKPDAVRHINEVGRSLVKRAISGIPSTVSLPRGTTPEEAAYYSENGPLWYRGWALDEDEEAVCARADEVTRLLGVRRLVVGHTPHFSGIWSRCDGRVIMIDTGISRAYGGALSALQIEYSLTPKGAPPPPDEEPGSTLYTWHERELVTALQEGSAPREIARVERDFELPI